MAFKRSRQYFEQLTPPNMQLRLAGSPTHRLRGRRRLEEDDRRGARPRDECPRIARELGAGVGTVLRLTGEAALATMGPGERAFQTAGQA
jgi:hypothetical protein